MFLFDFPTNFKVHLSQRFKSLVVDVGIVIIPVFVNFNSFSKSTEQLSIKLGKVTNHYWVKGIKICKDSFIGRPHPIPRRSRS